MTPPLFPRYAFVWIELQWHAARWCPGVIRLVLDGDKPAKVPDTVINDLKKRERNGLIELPPPPGRHRGDRVRIVRGAFAGQLGAVRWHAFAPKVRGAAGAARLRRAAQGRCRRCSLGRASAVRSAGISKPFHTLSRAIFWERA